MFEYPDQQDRLPIDEKAAVFSCQKHDLAPLKPLPLSGAAVHFPLFLLSGLADHSDKSDPDYQMQFPGASTVFYAGGQISLICNRNNFGHDACMGCRHGFVGFADHRIIAGME